jgi:hypothetical protein
MILTEAASREEEDNVPFLTRGSPRQTKQAYSGSGGLHPSSPEDEPM